MRSRTPATSLQILHPRLASLLALSAATLLLASPAAAQNALGGGNRTGNALDGNRTLDNRTSRGGALDKSLRVGSGGRNSLRAVDDFAGRNNIVTGNVAGGREFRGDPGFTSARAFRGAAGSDSLFRFRADSALSSLPAVMGGLSSDRYALAGQGATLQFDRDTTTQPLETQAMFDGREAQAIDLRAVIDRASSGGSTARLLERASEGNLVGGMTDSNTGLALAVLGSPVTGLRYEPMETNALSPVEVGLYDWRRANEDRLAGRFGVTVPGTPFQLASTTLDTTKRRTEDAAEAAIAADPSTRINLAVNDLRAEAGADPLAINPRKESSVRSSDYDAIVADLMKRYGTDAALGNTEIRVDADPELRARLGKALDLLRARLIGLTGSDELLPPTAPPVNPLEGLMAPETAPGTDLPKPVDLSVVPPAVLPIATDPVKPSEATPKPPEEGVPAPLRPLTLDEMGAMLRHGRTIDDLSHEEKTRVGELISRGEAQIASGDYFLAEQSFDRALRMAPSHPMATVGLVHSQLAAGLYLSASLTLRRFFTAVPEMIDTRYAEKLLPPANRIRGAEEAIRKLMSRDDRDRSNYGLALAYLGFQTNDTTTVREGLDVIEGGEAERTLRLLLKKIWLGE